MMAKASIQLCEAARRGEMDEVKRLRQTGANKDFVDNRVSALYPFFPSNNFLQVMVFVFITG
jgi:hypothetical protein